MKPVIVPALLLGFTLGGLFGISWTQYLASRTPAQVICQNVDLAQVNWKPISDTHLYPAWTIECRWPENPSPGTIIVLD